MGIRNNPTIVVYDYEHKINNVHINDGRLGNVSPGDTIYQTIRDRITGNPIGEKELYKVLRIIR